MYGMELSKLTPEILMEIFKIYTKEVGCPSEPPTQAETLALFSPVPLTQGKMLELLEKTREQFRGPKNSNGIERCFGSRLSPLSKLWIFRMHNWDDNAPIVIRFVFQANAPMFEKEGVGLEEIFKERIDEFLTEHGLAVSLEGYF